MNKTGALMQKAHKTGTVIPAFNIPYLPMMGPVVHALKDTETIGMIMVAHLELHKFEAESLESVKDEYERVKEERFTHLHLDHVPVIDEDNREIDYISVLSRALELGFDSVMIDGSRLPLEENISCTKSIVEKAHAAGVPVEAELGAVMGHEEGPLPPYEELFATGRGFTDPDEASRFVSETGADWLSVAVGSVHGAISKTRKDLKKQEARLDIEHLERISGKTGVPLVLHGGTGIRKEYIMEAVRHGIAKVNIATAVRQPYERALKESAEAGKNAVYETVVRIVTDDLEAAGSANNLCGKDD